MSSIIGLVRSSAMETCRPASTASLATAVPSLPAPRMPSRSTTCVPFRNPRATTYDAVHPLGDRLSFNCLGGAMDLELGIDTFGDVTLDSDGTLVSHAQVIRNVVDEAVLAEQSGLDVFGIGEHHRDDFAISSPEMVLAGIATRTERLRLASAVTVLSSDDPVRVFERFSTLDALSRGRAEVIMGRGSFTESFPLFGFDLGRHPHAVTPRCCGLPAGRECA